jgi:predicted small metal-binding protein
MKTLQCSDAGFNCKAVVTASTTEEVLQQAAQHALEVHGVQLTPEMATQISTLIKEDSN